MDSSFTTASSFLRFESLDFSLYDFLWSHPLALYVLWPITLLCLVCYLATEFSKRKNPDGSFRVMGAPKSAVPLSTTTTSGGSGEDEVDYILPFQTLSNLPKSDYQRYTKHYEEEDGTTSSQPYLRVPILQHESIYGTMHLSLSSYYSRVYKLPNPIEASDINTLKIAFSRALGAYPILAGRCQPEGHRDRSVILPVKCLVGEQQDTKDDSTTTQTTKYGVPFRVYQITDPKERPSFPLSPKDTADWCVLEDPQRVMMGFAPICNICVYLLPPSEGSSKSATSEAILSITVSHAVMDGVSMANFEQIWARECRKLFEIMEPPKSLEERQDPTAWVPHHMPLTDVPPVNRKAIPSAFDTMADYRAAQREFFGGRVLDDSPTLEGTLLQQAVGWLMIEFLMPYLRFLDDLQYLWGYHPDQHKHSISIPATKIQQLKHDLKPSAASGNWIASQDTVVAVLVEQLVQVLQERRRYKHQKLRVVLFRDARPYVGIGSNHCYGLGVLNWPIDIYEPHLKSTSELAVLVRKGLQDMHSNHKALRFWRMTTTVFKYRRWTFLNFVHKGLYDEGRSDEKIMINNSMFPLPDFGGTVGQATSLTTSAGPSIMLPQDDGGCRLFIEKELHNTLTQQRLEAAFS